MGVRKYFYLPYFIAGKVSNVDYHIEVTIFLKKEAEMLVVPSSQRKKMDTLVLFYKISSYIILALPRKNNSQQLFKTTSRA